MPKIQPYLSEEQDTGFRQAPGGNPLQQNPVALGLERFGNSVEDLGVAINTRQTQDEISDLSLKLSQKFSDQNEKLADQVQKGTLNTDQYAREMADDFQEIGDDVQTHGGKRYFAKQSAMMQRHLMTKMVSGQAELAGAKAKANYVETSNVRANNLMRNPEDLPVELSSLDTDVNELVAGGLDYSTALQLRTQTQSHFTKSAIQGVMRSNDQFEGPGAGVNRAKALLDSGTAFGQSIDQLISADTKKELYSEIDATRNKNRVAKNLADQAAANAAADKQDKILLDQTIPQAAAGTLTLQGIQQQIPDDPKLQEHWLDKSYEWAKRKNDEGDPRVEMDIRNRIFMPPDQPGSISSLAQLENATRGTYIPAHRYQQMVSLLEKDTVKGRALYNGRADFHKLALSLIHTDPVSGTVDPKGPILYRQAMQQAEAAEADFEKNGKNPLDLYDATSKDYLGNKIQALRRPFTEVLQEQADSMRKQVQENPDEWVNVIRVKDNVTGKVKRSQLKGHEDEYQVVK